MHHELIIQKAYKDKLKAIQKLKKQQNKFKIEKSVIAIKDGKWMYILRL